MAQRRPTTAPPITAVKCSHKKRKTHQMVESKRKSIDCIPARIPGRAKNEAGVTCFWPIIDTSLPKLLSSSSLSLSCDQWVDDGTVNLVDVSMAGLNSVGTLFSSISGKGSFLLGSSSISNTFLIMKIIFDKKCTKKMKKMLTYFWFVRRCYRRFSYFRLFGRPFRRWNEQLVA